MLEELGTPFYYPTSNNPVLFIKSKKGLDVYYDPTYEMLLEIEDRYGLPANEVADFIKGMAPGEHTLLIDVEAYLKAKEPSEMRALNEKITKLEQKNIDLQQKLHKMERSTRADILRRIARQLTEEADQVKPLFDED